MILLRPYTEFLIATPEPHELIEYAGRTCMMSRKRSGPDSWRKFIKDLIIRGHLSPLEHASATIRVICSRAISHQIVRHRIAAYSQESRRWVGHNEDVPFILPIESNILVGKYTTVPPVIIRNSSKKDQYWFRAMLFAEKKYHKMLAVGATQEEASMVLGQSLKTELIWTANFREWRHIFKERTSKRASMEMYVLMRNLLLQFKEKFPVIFDDIDWR